MEHSAPSRGVKHTYWRTTPPFDGVLFIPYDGHARRKLPRLAPKWLDDRTGCKRPSLRRGTCCGLAVSRIPDRGGVHGKRIAAVTLEVNAARKGVNCRRLCPRSSAVPSGLPPAHRVPCATLRSWRIQSPNRSPVGTRPSSQSAGTIRPRNGTGVLPVGEPAPRRLGHPCARVCASLARNIISELLLFYRPAALAHARRAGGRAVILRLGQWF